MIVDLPGRGPSLGAVRTGPVTPPGPGSQLRSPEISGSCRTGNKMGFFGETPRPGRAGLGGGIVVNLKNVGEGRVPGKEDWGV